MPELVDVRADGGGSVKVLICKLNTFLCSYVKLSVSTIVKDGWVTIF